MTCLLVLQSGFAAAGIEKNEPPRKSVNEVNVAATPETQALTAAWIESFRVANPDVKVNLITPDKASPSDILIITAGTTRPDNYQDGWQIVVGRDVIVPVMKESDPFFETVSGRGISPSEFAAILSSGGTYTWGQLLKSENNTPVAVMIPGDQEAISSLAGFASLEPGQINASVTQEGAALAGLTEAKSGVIVFCRLSDITDKTGQTFTAGVRIVPVDINGNGASDYFEQFYTGFDSFNRGVYIGKYPKTLCNNIYAASVTAPAEGAPSALISFILTDGQRSVTASGFTALARGEGLNKIESLAADKEIILATSEKSPVAGAWLWVLAVIAAVTLLAWVIYRITKAVNGEPEAVVFKPSAAFSLRTLVTPAGLMYDRSHAWTFMEKDGTVKVGIDDFLQHVTGSVSRVRMKACGEKVRKGDHIVSIIQNGKKLDIQSPVSGTIVARNERLANGASILNSSPYDEGWIYSMEPDNWETESRFMIAAGKYGEYLREEFGRIRDFLAVMPGINEPRLAQVVLQDGGEFKDGLLEEFGPEIWEEFQMKFLDQRH